MSNINCLSVTEPSYRFKNLTEEEQRDKGIMYFDIILTFNEFVESLEDTQHRLMGYMLIEKDEQSQLNSMIGLVIDVCEDKNLPVNILWKISTACNWTLFKEVTGKTTDFVDSTNGKLHFIQSEPRSVFEKQLTKKEGFGTDVYWGEAA
jgi:iron only hydrogenase large subunit-like protein